MRIYRYSVKQFSFPESAREDLKLRAAKAALPNAHRIYAGKETGVQLNRHWKTTVSAHRVILDRMMCGVKENKKHALCL